MGACDNKEELYETLLHNSYIEKIVVQMNRKSLHFKFIEPKRNGEYRHRLLTDLLHIILKEATLPINDKYKDRDMLGNKKKVFNFIMYIDMFKIYFNI